MVWWEEILSWNIDFTIYLQSLVLSFSYQTYLVLFQAAEEDLSNTENTANRLGCCKRDAEGKRYTTGGEQVPDLFLSQQTLPFLSMAKESYQLILGHSV